MAEIKLLTRAVGAGWIRRIVARCGGGLPTATPFRHRPQPSAAAETPVCQAHRVRPASAQPSEQQTISTAGSKTVSTSRLATQSLRTVAVYPAATAAGYAIETSMRVDVERGRDMGLPDS
jgi:hypothetical protein